jgi:LmbE family N-acetylglucosaminyl deacetylase
VNVRVAGVFAHPDDDSYVIGGTLLLHPGAIDLTLVFATSGEAGPLSDPALATRETLGRVREREQQAFLQSVGYEGADVHFLRHPDYYLPDVPFEDLVRQVETILRRAAPQIVVTFGPDGMTSHHDHIRAGEAATEAFHRARGGSPEDAFQRLYHAALSRSDVDRFYEGVARGGFDYGEEGRLFDLTGVPDDHIAVRVDTRTVNERKWEAICRHLTQMDEHERIPEPLRWIVLDSEAFVRAHPPRNEAEPVRRDLLEDVGPTAAPESRT